MSSTFRRFSGTSMGTIICSASRSAARHLEVSASTGVKWAQRWRGAGHLAPGKVGGHRRPKLESERAWLLARHGREKDITLPALLGARVAVRGVVVKIGRASGGKEGVRLCRIGGVEN